MTDESLILSSIGTGRNGARCVGSMLGYKAVPHGNFPDAVLPIEIPFTRASTGMEFVNGLWQDAAINMPRRYNDAYLNEPPATNSLLRSNTLSDAVWQKQAGVSVAASASLSPDGTLDAWTITYPAIDSRQVFQALSLGSATYTVSIWAKSATGRTFRLKVYNGSADTFSADFTTTSSWQLFQYTFTSAIVNVGIVNGTAGLAGDLDVWNCQEEVGSVATSPIITAGSAVTRAADAPLASNFGNVIPQTEGGFFLDFEMPSIVGSGVLAELANISSQNLNFQYSGSTLYWYSNAGGFSCQTTIAANTRYKVLGLYKTNAVQFWVNGVLVESDLTSSVHASLSKFSLGCSTTPANNVNIKIYESQLTPYLDAVAAAALTTL